MLDGMSGGGVEKEVMAVAILRWYEHRMLHYETKGSMKG